MTYFAIFLVMLIPTLAEIVIPDCECVKPSNCQDAKVNPIRCPMSELICCQNITTSTSPTTETSKTTATTEISKTAATTEILKPATTVKFTKLFISGKTMRPSTTTASSTTDYDDDDYSLNRIFVISDNKPENLSCGMGATDSNFNFKGHDDSISSYAYENEFPWVVEILRKHANNATSTLCGGVLLDFAVVVTSAHCVQGIKKEEIYVRGGEYDLADVEEKFPHQEATVSDIFVHPQFDFGTGINNIAVLIVFGFKQARNINNICPLNVEEQNRNDTWHKCFVAGWGHTKLDSSISPTTMNKMRKVQMRMITARMCTRQLRKTNLGEDFTLKDGTFCASPKKKTEDVGMGFGGAPLFCYLNNQKGKKGHYSLVGITSGSAKDAPGTPGVYTTFFRYNDWVQNVTTEVFG